MTVTHMLQSVTSRELAEWMAYFKIQREEQTRERLATEAEAGVRVRRKR